MKMKAGPLQENDTEQQAKLSQKEDTLKKAKLQRKGNMSQVAARLRR